MISVEKPTIDYNCLRGQVLCVAKSTTKTARQKNLAIQSDVLEDFEEFCRVRAHNEGMLASFALYHILRLDATDREKLAVEFDRWQAKRGSREGTPPPGRRGTGIISNPTKHPQATESGGNRGGSK